MINKEISAELLLNYLYPDKMETWRVETKGAFFRNYNQDVMELDAQKNNVALARDGLMQMLPEGFFSNERSKKEENRKQEKWRLDLIHEAFMPLHTFAFRSNLKLESEVTAMLNDSWDYLLTNVIGYKPAETPYTEMMGVLPLIRNHKGDLQFVKALLSALCQCEVKFDCSHRYSMSDSTRRWLPMVRYELLIENLDAEHYTMLREKLQPLIEFVQEWLMPFEMKCEIAIKDHGCDQVSGDKLILDYNTEL